jgi:hypothetical protein
MISAEFQLEYDMQRAKDKIQAEYNEATKVIGKESLKYVENAAIETVISLSKQIAPMGATAAENYLSAWSTVISDSNLNALTSK